MNPSRAADLDRIPAPWLVVAGVSSVQLGAAIAKSLFDELTPTGLVMLRLVFGALILGLFSVRGSGTAPPASSSWRSRSGSRS